MERILIVAADSELAAELEALLQDDGRAIAAVAECEAAADHIQRGHAVDVLLLATPCTKEQRANLLRRVQMSEPHLEMIWLFAAGGEELMIEALRSRCFDIIPRPTDNASYLIERVAEAARSVGGRREHDALVQELINGAERYELAARGANDGLWDWDRRRDCIYLSPRWKNMLGYAEHELTSDPEQWWRLIHPEDREEVERILDVQVLRGTEVFHKEIRMQHKDGSYRWLHARGLAVLGAEGRVVRIVGSQSDVTDRKMAEQQLVYEALHDQLTGLANRTLFLEQVGRVLEAFRGRPDGEWTVMVLGIDAFQSVNESLGPHGGDEVLCMLAHRLQDAFPEDATVARVGGDEFAVLAHAGVGFPDPVRAHEILVAVLAEPFVVSEQEIYVTAAIGIAQSASNYGDAAEVLRDASIALHRAKGRGRGRSAVFEQSMHADALRRFKLDSALRHAVSRRQFVLCYQPIVSLQSGTVLSLEALLRWVHPERGRVPPGEFIPLAESNGLIVEIGAWAMEQACRQAVAWQQRLGAGPPLGISVNVSERQLMARGFIDVVRSIVDRTGIDPQLLHIEITESVLIGDFAAAAAVLGALKDMGVVLSMDDFGTGYSALSYLHRLPFDTLKIDRQFVMDLEANARNVALVDGAVSMAHTLGMDVVAEGIETEHQLVLLRAAGCDFGQGYLLSRPLDVEPAEELLFGQGRQVPVAALRPAQPTGASQLG